MSGKRERVVVCSANAYEQKYYFNQEFSKIPQSLQEELRIICVLYTQEVGGIFTMLFDEDGELVFETQADEFDITYDEVSSGLLISEIRRNRAELLESLELYYRVFICGESIEGLLDESDDSTED